MQEPARQRGVVPNKPDKPESTVPFIERLLLYYGVYRRYPLRPWPAFKNACRVVFR
jgi:hypothetical protein